MRSHNDEGDTYGRYLVVRIGLKWEIVVRGSDGLVRSTYTGRFWRWITAARLAQAMDMAYRSGIDDGSITVELEDSCC